MGSDRYHGFKVSSDIDGTTSTFVYHGGKSEMEALAAEHRIDEAGESGWLRSIRVYQHDGADWECELKYEAPEEWTSISKPERKWGRRNCQLRGAMLSRPLESHPGYRTCWNHRLCAAPGVSTRPAWYESATDTAIPAADADRYCWCRTFAEPPHDDSGAWRVLAEAVKPGVESYDLAAYSVVETARFRSASAAGRMVGDVLNRIGTPANTFGITGGSWKCDDAEVSWNGSCWIARLSWTRSGDDAGWDADLYE